MSFFAKMERKFGRFAIRNLPVKIGILMAVSYFLWMFLPNFAAKLIFYPYFVIYNHEYWRLFTWIFSLPGNVDFISVLMIFCLILFGRQIEAGMGTFMFNVYVFGCWFWNTAVMLGMSIFYYATDSMLILTDTGYLAMYYFTYGIFLAFALMYSDSVVMFMFVLPLRTFWVAVIDMGLMAYEFIKAFQISNYMCCGSIIAYLINFFIFYLIMARGVGMRSSNSRSAEMRRRKDYERRMDNLSRQVNGEADRRRRAQKGDYPPNITKHRCAVCGRTERDGDELEFRFCSKCNGNYEYCQDHLFTHTHVK